MVWNLGIIHPGANEKIIFIVKEKKELQSLKDIPTMGICPYARISSTGAENQFMQVRLTKVQSY